MVGLGLKNYDSFVPQCHHGIRLGCAPGRNGKSLQPISGERGDGIPMPHADVTRRGSNHHFGRLKSELESGSGHADHRGELSNLLHHQEISSTLFRGHPLVAEVVPL